MNIENIEQSDSQLQRALDLHQAGHLSKALALYDSVLKLEPDNSEALHLSGLIVFQQGDTEKAVMRIKHAVGLRPQSTTYLKNLCAILISSNRIEETALAQKFYKKLVTLNPHDYDSWFCLGNIYQQFENINEAVNAYIQTIQIKPDHVGALHNLGAAYDILGDHKKAVDCFKSALRIEPQAAQVHFSLGNVYLSIGAMSAAVKSLKKAILIKPDYTDARFNLANIYKNIGNSKAAIENYFTLIERNPTMAEAHNNLGSVFYGLNQKKEALQCYQAALELRSDYPEALHNISLIFQDDGKYEEAIRFCQKAVEINPEYEAGYASLVHQMRQACDWSCLGRLDDYVDRMTERALTENRRPVEDPFLNISRHADPSINFRVARAWSRELSKYVDATHEVDGSSIYTNHISQNTGSRIKVGYLSNNFRNHPTAHLLTRLFGLHDREKFEAYAYSYGPDDGSAYRKRIEQDCDRFVDLKDVTDDEAVRLIRADSINILVDLVGFMKGHRLGICALRPAPIQVRYLGMAGTSGADFFDYLIADRVVVPEEQAPYYSEQLAYMPHCYQINDDRQPIADVAYTRSDFDLPENTVVYCSFASHYKIDPIMFTAWMRILKQVDASVLWLTPGSKIAERNLNAQAEAQGVAPERLVFADRLSKEHHLARLRLADLALDTRVVGGAATTSDALWSGVPVITLKGQHFASRMSASILKAMGLKELVTSELVDYEALAVQLGRNRLKLNNVKQKLIQQRESGHLFATSDAVRHLERAYAAMWDTFKKGAKPATLTL